MFLKQLFLSKIYSKLLKYEKADIFQHLGYGVRLLLNGDRYPGVLECAQVLKKMEHLHMLF